ncbi:MAG TPA: cysteine desulfurase family protein [Phycisphaerales bacterium]|nr:cysteine desulfurase family protein [Phycisphaerales bacterium]
MPSSGSPASSPYPSTLIYLDNNATTQPAEQVVEAVAQAMRTRWANPSSIHRAGQDARHAVELARASVAALIGANPKNITFTSGGTESIDLAVRGVLSTPSTHSPPQPTPVRVVSTRIEHAAVRELLVSLEKQGAVTLGFLDTDGWGCVKAESLEREITPGTRLVSVQWANNETGTVQEIGAIAARCRAVGAVFHCDGTQWVGKNDTDVGEVSGSPPPCDILTFSAHKWHGPKGVGIVWARPGVRLPPRIHGTQEKGRRGGTENAEGIIGAGVAAQLAAGWLADAAGRERGRELCDRFNTRVFAGLGDMQLRDNTVAAAGAAPCPARLWNTTNIGFHRLEAEALLMAFSEQGLCASAGAACSSGSLDPSPVLLAMGVPAEFAHGSVRFSLSRYSTREEIDRAAEIVIACVRKVRRSMA